MSNIDEMREKIQDWVDNRFGLQNHFNTQLLIDFVEFLKQELGYRKLPESELPLLPIEEVIEINKEARKRANDLASDTEGHFKQEDIEAIYDDAEIAKLVAQRQLCKIMKDKEER